MCLPVRTAFRNISAVQMPIPVFSSGVRLIAYVVPKGPENEVKVAPTETIQGPDGGGAGGIFMASGWPDSMRVMSGSGPAAPIFQGVWQSLQPMSVTRYLPRSTRAPPAAGLDWASASKATPSATRSRAKTNAAAPTDDRWRKDSLLFEPRGI